MGRYRVKSEAGRKVGRHSEATASDRTSTPARMPSTKLSIQRLHACAVQS
jgi:hypothetical protein